MLKSVAFLLLLIGPAATVMAQSPDSMLHRVGVFGDLDGSFIDYAGVKYRISSDWSSYLRFRVHISDRRRQYANYPDEDKRTEFEASLGLERVVFAFDQLSLVVFASAGYNSGRSTGTTYTMPAGTTGTLESSFIAYAVAGGIGAEYFITSRLSVALRQTAIVEWTSGEYRDSMFPNNNSTNEATDFSFGLVHATFSLYF